MTSLGQPFYREINTVASLKKQGKLGPLSLSIIEGSYTDFSDPNDNDTRIPLFLAISNGNLELVKQLINHGADYKTPPIVSIFTPLAHAVLSDQKDIALYLKSLS
jgi:ankyrin repeat protein